MQPRFSRNIGHTGRIARGVVAAALLVGAGFGFSASLWLGIGLGVAGAFALFEALRGWCVLRACGIKTRF